jgi:peptidoglycan hydrolase-like protein with peptidoglycan-binding domain
MGLRSAARRLSGTSGKRETRPAITMFDDVVVALMPRGDNYAYAGYVGGHFPTFAELPARFPNHSLLSIAVSAGQNAECLDVEKGDADISQAPGWVHRQLQRGLFRPCLYTSASNLRALEHTLAAAGLKRSDYRLWAAHYTGRAHFCGPRACGFGLSEADGCQFTDRALGLSLDQSILKANFFDTRPVTKPVPPTPVPAPPPAPPAPVDPLEAIVKQLPALKQGDKDKADKPAHVRIMQGLIKANGHAYGIEAANSLALDGDFGVHTTNALLAMQTFFGLTADRVCGPKTWTALILGEK